MKRWLSLSHPRSSPGRSGILYFMAISPAKVGGMELFAVELARQLRMHNEPISYCFLTSPSDVVRKLLERAGAEYYSLAPQNGFLPRTVLAQWRLLRRLRPRCVIYAFGGIARPLPWLCRLAGVPEVVYNDHTSRTDEDKTTLPQRLRARLLTLPINKVIAVSAFVAQCSLQEGLHRAPVVCVHNGIDIERGARSLRREVYLRRLGIPEQRRIVSQLSWLVESKGVDIFLNAAAIVLQQRNDVHFLVGGTGIGYDQYTNLTHELGIASHVTFTGELPDPLCSGFYAATDVFCLASRWQEACGLVLLEAMSMGVPVVASHLGGVPEYVQDTTDGMLVAPTAENFARAILALLEDEYRRRQMGAAAQRNVWEHFNLRRMAAGYARQFLSGQARTIDLAAMRASLSTRHTEVPCSR